MDVTIFLGLYNDEKKIFLECDRNKVCHLPYSNLKDEDKIDLVISNLATSKRMKIDDVKIVKAEILNGKILLFYRAFCSEVDSGKKEFFDINNLEKIKISELEIELIRKGYEDINLVENIQQISNSVDKLEDERLEIENKLKRALADYINLQKNLDSRLDLALTQQSKKLANGLITLADDAFMALQALEKIDFSGEQKAWVDGVSHTLKKVYSTLQDIGVEKIVVQKGDHFNSNYHEALSILPTNDKKLDGKIADIIQEGFRLGDTIIRPARVVVGKLQ